VSARIDDVTGVVLVGGSSRRMGFDKALLPWDDRTLLEAIVERLGRVFRRVLIVGGRHDDLAIAGCEHAPDRLAGGGAIVGIHAALAASTDPRAFVMACDACHPAEDLIRFLVAHDPAAAWVCPRTRHGLEPLFAVYAQACRRPLEALVAQGIRRIRVLADHVPTVFVAEPLLRRHDPELRSFVNLNTPADLARSSDGAELPAWTARRSEDGGLRDVTVPVVPEVPLTIRLNGRTLTTLLTDGTHPVELALGFLYNDGWLEDHRQVRALDVGTDGSEVSVTLQGEEAAVDAADHGDAGRAATTGCSQGSGFARQLALLRSGRWTVAGELRLPLAALCGQARELAERSSVYRRTRSLHAAALLDGANVLCFREDVGRHNALDKLAGWLLRARPRTAGFALFLTGRITGEVVLKAARMGTPLVFSLARPTLLALRLAQQHGITVVGTAGSASCLVFTHSHRVADL
jgi:FdhD protein